VGFELLDAMDGSEAEVICSDGDVRFTRKVDINAEKKIH
jgi:hypothetical protein